ncbi:MAG: helix-turn-helix transcriptional regulator [Actinomycetes bacterium]
MTVLRSSPSLRSAAAASAASVAAAVAPATPDEVRRAELAAFLRSRRERISPREVGLPDAGRRRTPGLRREEVATLAGVGVTWYTWLEQARDIRVSEQVLAAISRTLLLDVHERAHLFTLAGAVPPREEEDNPAVRPEVRALLDKLDPYPAFVSNARYDVLAANRAYRVLVGDVDALPVEERNILWMMFAKQTTSRCFVNRDEARSRMVAQLRGAMAEHVADPAWKCLVRRLERVSPEFSELWQRHDVTQPETVLKQYLHPDLGLLQFTHTVMWLTAASGLRLVAYVPADEATASATAEFERLEPRPVS